MQKPITKNDPYYVYHYVGKNVKKYREEKNWTRVKLSVETGFSTQYIGNLENNTRQTFSVASINIIAKALGVELYKFFIDNE